MSTKQDLERVREALSCADFSNYSFDELMEQYDMLKAIQGFEQTQPTFVREFPGRKVKEIALQAAIAMRPAPSYSSNLQSQVLAQPHYNLLTEAEKIYQWLVSDSSKPKDTE